MRFSRVVNVVALSMDIVCGTNTILQNESKKNYLAEVYCYELFPCFSSSVRCTMVLCVVRRWNSMELYSYQVLRCAAVINITSLEFIFTIST